MKFGTKELKSSTLLGSPRLSYSRRPLEHNVGSQTTRLNLPSPITSSANVRDIAVVGLITAISSTTSSIRSSMPGQSRHCELMYWQNSKQGSW